MYSSNWTYQCICTDTFVTILVSNSAGFPMPYHMGSATQTMQRNLSHFMNVYKHFHIFYIRQRNEKALPFEVQKVPILSNFKTFSFHVSFQFFVVLLKSVRHEPLNEKTIASLCSSTNTTQQLRKKIELK